LCRGLSSAGIDVALIVAGRRYDIAHDATIAATVTEATSARSMTDRIDGIVTSRWLGIPIFLGLMWFVFKLITDISGAFLAWIDSAVSGPISGLAMTLLEAVGLGGSWVESLVIDGVIVGVGAVLVFVPVLASLYFALAVLEDTGYMARAAFVMDRVMRGIGLPGTSFLPMLVGFGCTVPAVYATRTLERRRDRIVTALIVPFMSCGARLPVYVLLAAVFFPDHGGRIVFAMYLLGIAVALVVGVVLRSTVLPASGNAAAIMELPPFRAPTARSLWIQTRLRTMAFLSGAGTTIFATMIVVWFLMAVPASGQGTFADTDIDDSVFAAVAGAVAPVLEPAGLGSWEATGSLMSGLVAKEVVIGTMAQTYGISEDDEVESTTLVRAILEIGAGFTDAAIDSIRAIPGVIGMDLAVSEESAESSTLVASVRASFEESSGGHGAAAGLAFMVFVLLYTPCIAAAAAIRHEVGTRWMWSSVLGQTSLAWVMAVVVFQVGILVGL
ncbi:MAG TPA: ferrous iron transport protein B, partial [Acidimicrobiia bacterium]|nr:ferrous iron transport protein B [Acidimicrobiia bacterium]